MGRLSKIRRTRYCCRILSCSSCGHGAAGRNGAQRSSQQQAAGRGAAPVRQASRPADGAHLDLLGVERREGVVRVVVAVAHRQALLLGLHAWQAQVGHSLWRSARSRVQQACTLYGLLSCSHTAREGVSVWYWSHPSMCAAALDAAQQASKLPEPSLLLRWQLQLHVWTLAAP